MRVFEWPWVSRKYLNLNKDFDRQITTNLHREIAGLEKEILYYRERAEAEKDRADRAVDALVQWCGREPISSPSRESQESQKLAVTEMQKQMGEIFGDVSESILAEPNESEENPENIPEAHAKEVVKSIAERLEELVKIPFYSKAAKAGSTESSEVTSTQDTISK